MEVLSKHAGLWITTNNDVFYSQATHITFICPMRFDSFPLDTQVWPFWLLADPIWQTFCQIFWQTQSYNSGFFWLLSIHTYLIESKIEARCNNAQYFNLIDFFSFKCILLTYDISTNPNTAHQCNVKCKAVLWLVETFWKTCLGFLIWIFFSSFQNEQIESINNRAAKNSALPSFL